MTLEENIIKEQVRLVSHEIRNQLSISDVYCEIIKKQMERNNIENEAISRALECIQKAAKLIGNSLLDLKSLSNFKTEPVDINQLIEEGIELGKSYFYEKNIRINTELTEKVTIDTDKNKFLACLINLIKNAAEAIETDGIITIKTLIQGENFKIKVSNSGKPIPKQTREKLFNNGFTTKQTGSGIGLYLSRENLRALGGDLKLNDTKNTEFEITLKM